MTARCISASPQSPAPLSTSASGTAAVRSQSSTLSIFLLIPSFLSLFVALAEAGGLLVVVFFPPPTFLNLLILEFLCSFFFFPFSPLLLLPLSLTLYLPLPSFLSVLFLPTIHLRLRWSHRLPLFSSSPSFIPPVCPPVSSTFVSVSIFAAFRRNLRLLIHVHGIGFCCSVSFSYILGSGCTRLVQVEFNIHSGINNTRIHVCVFGSCLVSGSVHGAKSVVPDLFCLIFCQFVRQCEQHPSSSAVL